MTIAEMMMSERDGMIWVPNPRHPGSYAGTVVRDGHLTHCYVACAAGPGPYPRFEGRSEAIRYILDRAAAMPD